MALENLVNRQGALAETYSQLDPNTIQHSAEIMNDRRTDRDLRKKWFWTADFPMYRIEDDEAVLYIAGRENNLIFEYIEEATRQIIRNINYVPEQEDIARVVASVESGETLRIKLSDLGLKRENSEWSYFEIDTAEYDETLNPEQRKVAERFYGQGDDFVKNMKMLKEEGISKTRVNILNLDYVENHVEEDGAVARACWLSCFGDSSGFLACDWLVDVAYSSLRGVLSKVAEGDDA